MLKINQGGRGFSIGFQNGAIVSVQFGPNHYCSHHGTDPLNRDTRNLEVPSWASADCEVAVIGPPPDGGFITRKFYKDLGDDVKGYVESEELADLIYSVCHGAGPLILP